jgi:hypothetical protein
VVKHGSERDALAFVYLLEDGNSLTRFFHGGMNEIFQKRYRSGYTPPPTSPTTTAAAAHAISGTKWAYGNTSAILEFFSDGKMKSGTTGKETTSKWIAVNAGTVKTATGTSTFSLSFDQKTLTQTNAGKAYVWNRVADAAAASLAIPPNSTQTLPSPTSPTKENPPAQSLRAEFEALNKKNINLFVESMRSWNRQDMSSLEALKKRLGGKDIELLQKIQSALEAVANNETFDVDGLPKLKKRTANERAFVSIKDSRDRNLASVQKSVSSKSKSAYDALLKRATAANELELAKEIRAGGLWPVGSWRECFGGKDRVVLEANGTARHKSGIKGKWMQNSSGEFTITRGGGWGHMWAGSTWKVSMDGKTLQRTDPNPKYKDWKLVRE